MNSPLLRLDRRIVVAAAASSVLIALVGFLAGVPSDVPPALAAACQGANAVCLGGDTSKTSAMYVHHHTSPSYVGTSTVVEPDSGETWSITAYFNTAGIGWNCFETSQTATADVYWNGSSWVLSNVNTTTNIVNIGICQGDTCDGGDSTHAWDYKLIVDIVEPVAIPPLLYNLRTVRYSTSSVDDGYTVEDPTETQGYCYTDAVVSPTSQTNTAYDTPAAGTWGLGRCGYSCGITGGSITLYYD